MSDKPTYERIARRKTYELVAEALIQQISARALAPGDTLPPERELVASYGVGRSSVREALRMLESRGLIEGRGNGAFAVSQWRNPLNQSLSLLIAASEGDLHDLFEVRRILEGGAAALAAARRTDEHVAALHAAIADMEEGIGAEDRYIEADVRFHLTVAEATGNRVALHLMHAIRHQLQDAFGTVYHIPGSPERSLEQHREIASAIALRRPDEARDRMHEHIGRVEGEIDRSAVPRRAGD